MVWYMTFYPTQARIVCKAEYLYTFRFDSLIIGSAWVVTIGYDLMTDGELNGPTITHYVVCSLMTRPSIFDGRCVNYVGALLLD